MRPDSPHKTGRKMAKFWIWTIRKHSFIAANVKIYMFAAVALILFLCIGGVIHLKTALVSIFFGGLSLCALLWVCIENRRTALNGISDPELRKEAHEAMLLFIYPRKKYVESSVKPKRRFVRRWLWKKFIPELF